MPQITQVSQPPPQVALAFNNPTYQFESLATSSPRTTNKVHPTQVLPHHLLINNSLNQANSRAYPLSHSQSSHAASYNSSPVTGRGPNYNNQLCSSSLSSAQSVEDLVCARVTLSGSDDTSSLVSTTSTPPQSTLDINSRLNFNPNSNGYGPPSSTQPSSRSHANNCFKSAAPRTNPRCLPTTAWKPQYPQANLRSSINNLSRVDNGNDAPDHHHSTSDLLSSSSYSHPRRTNQKNPRRQSAEYGSSRPRHKQTYDSTSDDTSSDERPVAANGPLYPRNRYNNSNVSTVPPNRLSAKRISEPKSLEEVSLDIFLKSCSPLYFIIETCIIPICKIIHNKYITGEN